MAEKPKKSSREQRFEHLMKRSAETPEGRASGIWKRNPLLHNYTIPHAFLMNDHELGLESFAKSHPRYSRSQVYYARRIIRGNQRVVNRLIGSWRNGKHVLASGPALMELISAASPEERTLRKRRVPTGVQDVRALVIQADRWIEGGLCTPEIDRYAMHLKTHFLNHLKSAERVPEYAQVARAMQKVFQDADHLALAHALVRNVHSYYSDPNKT
ncbi:hypothetical protein KJ765_01060 [Candidatus Micrarchaeota archaeon]|nr:hypothetical protein [Candidatus Micrarchaeota archaeon]